jgi:hypothetical protein
VPAVKGFFRPGANEKAIEQLAIALDCGHDILKDGDPQLMAGLFKKWLADFHARNIQALVGSSYTC